MATKRSGRGWRIFVVAMVCIGVAGMLGLLLLVFGSVSGTEFSPTHFESRQFSVREIPWLKIQISPIQRKASQSATARYLIAQSLIQPPQASSTGSTNGWHLVEFSRGGMSGSIADAKLLTDQLEMTVNNQSGSKEFWHDWSINEPAKAKVLWPIVQKLAIRELYILLPKLFSMAIDAKDDRSLANSINDYLRASYLELIAEMRSADRNELADELLAEAIVDYPDDKKLRALP